MKKVRLSRLRAEKARKTKKRGKKECTYTREHVADVGSAIDVEDGGGDQYAAFGVGRVAAGHGHGALHEVREQAAEGGAGNEEGRLCGG